MEQCQEISKLLNIVLFAKINDDIVLQLHFERFHPRNSIHNIRDVSKLENYCS